MPMNPFPIQTPGELLAYLTARAREYRVICKASLDNNPHLHDLSVGEDMPQRVIDAVLTDFINVGVAYELGVDYAMKARNLAEGGRAGEPTGEDQGS